MSEFVQKPARSIELPLGCKDLIDVSEIRNWRPGVRLRFLAPSTDKLAYIGGYLTRLLKSAGTSHVVCISRFQDKGQVTVIRDPDLGRPVLFALWHNVAQQQALRALFDEAGLSPISEPVGRWKGKRSLRYPLPSGPSAAARFICEVLRAGYGLNDLAVIRLFFHENPALPCCFRQQRGCASLPCSTPSARCA